MAGGLWAVFKALADDAAQAGRNVGEALAGFFGKTAEKEEESVARTLDAEAENVNAISAIREGAAGGIPGDASTPGLATTLDGARYAIGRDGGEPAARPGDFGLPKDAPADSSIGPYAPAGLTDEVKGLSTFKSPELLAPNAKGPVWELPDGTQLPNGSAILNDGSEVGGNMPEGHSTIYPSRETTLSDFQNANKNYGWAPIGRIRELKDGTRIFTPNP